MRKFGFLLVLMPLVACANLPAPPTITINPATNTATSAPANTAATGSGPLTQINTALGNTFSQDDTAAINMACGTPIVDPIGCTFATDLANLSNSLANQTTSPATPGIIAAAEAARLAIIKGTASATNPLLTKTLVDGLIWVQDTKAKALAVPVAVTGLLTTIASTLAAGAL